MSSVTGPAMEFLGRVFYEIHQMKPLIPTYIHLMVSAIFPIYTAAHASLARPSSAAPAKKKKDTDVSELQDEEISPTIETLSPSDAILFPILAGTTLASLYFILKWLQDPALLNYYLGLYFAIVGLFFQIKFVKDTLATTRSFILPNQYSYRGQLWRLVPGERRYIAGGASENEEIRTSPFPGMFGIAFQHHNSILWMLRELLYTKLRLKFSIWRLVNIVTFIDTLDLAGLVIATPLVLYHTFIEKPWFLTNILGFSFCYGSLQITTPGTSWTGTLLLSALFFYDIYFVFFTPMMLTVATKLDVPIKLLFPRPDGCVKPVGAVTGSKEMEEYLQCLAKKRTMAMLGLGDIVIPGMMLAFALRFDLYLFYHKLSAATSKVDAGSKDSSDKSPYLPATGSWGERFWTTKKLHSPELRAKQFPKTYFNASVIGYVVGMISTVVAMQVSQHAQPALLYLVPGVLISFWGVALIKGDLKALWHYSEVPENEKKDDKKDDVNDADQKLIQDSEEETDKTTDSQDKTDDVNGKNVKEAIKSAAPDSTTTKDKSTTNSSDAQEKPRKPDDQDLIYFSLSVIPSKKNEPPPTNTDETAPQIEPKPEGFDVQSESTDEWLSEEEHVENAQDTRITRSQSGKAKQNIGAQTSGNDAGGSGVADGEPAVKRRRKA